MQKNIALEDNVPKLRATMDQIASYMPRQEGALALHARAHRRILIVEDDCDVRDALRQILEMEGYEVCTAANGKEAVCALADSPPPRLILLDLMMPVMSGWEFLARRRASDAISRIPVVVLSATPNVRAPGATDLLTKPIALDCLLTVLQRYYM